MERKSQNQTLKSPFKTNYTRDKGPSIRVLFFAEQASLKKISLSLSNHFNYEVQGSATSLLEQQIHSWINSYINKNQGHFPEPFFLPHHTPFQQKVLQTLYQTPFGATLSYSKLAELSGFPKAARAVGSVCKANPFPLLIPCHRVLPATGALGKFNGGSEIKKRLLCFEGAFFKKH